MPIMAPHDLSMGFEVRLPRSLRAGARAADDAAVLLGATVFGALASAWAAAGAPTAAGATGGGAFSLEDVSLARAGSSARAGADALPGAAALSGAAASPGVAGAAPAGRYCWSEPEYVPRFASAMAVITAPEGTSTASAYDFINAFR